ncbi:hypothetical protein [Xenorhabdus sp. PB62.4]|uniref:hypothetical protein n=1 Tax=Xenorhabdus sp. PB62.4 TaxID=1851573 RepID=UPI001657577A|nr:hypothetical protein [Xenorhabdus sp. PB62.4]MBC8954028.1 hypothetical protein [Xenorhabdus sp. PB62.4]
MELTELNKKLSDLVPMSDFKLDNRTSLQLLKYIEDYTKIIPFNQDNNHWNDFFFMANNTPEKLAELYQGEMEANGELLPHQAFLLAVLRLLETPISLLNTLPAAHRELYYRALLGLSSRPAQPDQVALSVELNSTVTEQLLTKGTLFEAGQDEQGNALQYAQDASLLANRGYISDLCWLRKKENQQWVTATPWDSQAQLSLPSDGIRLFSETDLDKSVLGGVLITSAQLMMEEGTRKITVTFDKDMSSQNLVAQISSGNQWLTLTPKVNTKEVTLELSDKEPAISAPEDLDNLIFSEPVLRLQGKDSQALPTVTALKVQETIVDKTAFDTYNLTPFGYSPEISETDLDKSVLGGMLITSAQLMMEEGTRKITVTFDKDMSSQNLIAQISSGNQWLTLTPKVNTKEVTLELSDKEPAISAPEDLDNLIFSEPVLRLQGKDSQALPTVTALKVQETIVDKTAFDTYNLPPFGYSPEIEPLEENPVLYLGVTDIEPGQTLSLYWKLKSPQQPTKVFWYYLNQKNQWATLDAWVNDKTKNLYQDGTWQVVLPADATNQATRMPTERYWLKAVVVIPTHKGSWGKNPWLYGLIYNAITATLVNVDSISNSHFLAPLPAGSIQRPVEPIMVVASINQPWPSWNGRVPESYNAFFERGAQHLSHRNRALTWGNMATLLKEHYVSIFDVKYPSNDELTRVPALEKQQLTIIPANRYNDSDDPFRPVLNPARLQGMAEWLQQKSSPWAEIEISNPQYVDVKINYTVIFKPDVNEDFGYRQLRQQLSEAYMPWSVDEQRPVMLNNSINYYQLLATIQQQPLVERVTCLTLRRSDAAKGSDITASVEAKDNEVLILVWEADDKLQCRGNNYE